MDERTVATEVRELFRELSIGSKPMGKAIAGKFDAPEGTERFYLVLASLRSKCDQLARDISASPLKESSKGLYLGAVATLSRYIGVDAMFDLSTDELRSESQAFQYLTLVDDFLAPLDFRVVPKPILIELGDKASSILADLQGAGLEPRLTAFLQAQISQFIWALQNYEALGIDGVSRAWGSMASELMRSQGMHGSTAPQAKSWFKKAVPIVGYIGVVVTTASATVERADNLLTHGSHIMEVLGHHSDPTVHGKGKELKQVPGSS